MSDDVIEVEITTDDIEVGIIEDELEVGITEDELGIEITEDELEIEIAEDEIEVEITHGGEFYMIFVVSVTMTTSPQSFTFAALGLPPAISGAKIPARPETKVEREVFVTACNNTGFALKASDIGEGELPLTFSILIIGG